MLSRVERATLVAVVLVGVLVLTAMVVAALRWQDIKAWLDAPDVIAAHRAVVAADLPPELEPDPTGSACEDWTAIRCAWADVPAEDAAEAMASALRAAGVAVDPVVCDGQGLPALLGGESPRCGAAAEVRDATLWVLATDETIVGGVPLGRTAAWVAWDAMTLSIPLMERMASEWEWAVPAERLDSELVAALVPERVRAVLDAPCRAEDDTGCFVWRGPVDVSDLDPDGVVAGLVAELTADGHFVGSADPDWSTPIRAHRFSSTNRSTGVAVTLRDEDGVVVAEIVTY